MEVLMCRTLFLIAFAAAQTPLDLGCHTDETGVRCFQLLVLDAQHSDCWPLCTSYQMVFAKIDTLPVYSTLKANWYNKNYDGSCPAPGCSSIGCSFWLAAKKDASVPRYVWEQYSGQPVSQAIGITELWSNISAYGSINTDHDTLCTWAQVFTLASSWACPGCTRCGCICERPGRIRGIESYFKIKKNMGPRAFQAGQLLKSWMVDDRARSLSCGRRCHQQPSCFSFVLSTVSPGSYNCFLYSAVDLAPSTQNGVDYGVIID